MKLHSFSIVGRAVVTRFPFQAFSTSGCVCFGVCVFFFYVIYFLPLSFSFFILIAPMMLFRTVVSLFDLASYKNGKEKQDYVSKILFTSVCLKIQFTTFTAVLKLTCSMHYSFYAINSLTELVFKYY